MICENCEQEHDGTYGSGRFCSSICARSFSTKNKRSEINEKISKSLIGNTPANKGSKWNQSDEAKDRISEGHRTRSQKRFLEGKATKKLARKILIEQNGNICEECKTSEWLGSELMMHIHHIDGNPQNNMPENLRLLCPNCHSQTDNWGNKTR